MPVGSRNRNALMNAIRSCSRRAGENYDCISCKDGEGTRSQGPPEGSKSDLKDIHGSRREGDADPEDRYNGADNDARDDGVEEEVEKIGMGEEVHASSEQERIQNPCHIDCQGNDDEPESGVAVGCPGNGRRGPCSLFFMFSRIPRGMPRVYQMFRQTGPAAGPVVYVREARKSLTAFSRIGGARREEAILSPSVGRVLR